MSNVVSEIRKTILEDGVAVIGSEMYDRLQGEWIRRSLGDEMLKQVKSDMAASDARAGKAERMLEDERQFSLGRANWLQDAKQAAGYHYNTSFDEVWADALQALLEKRHGGA